MFQGPEQQQPGEGGNGNGNRRTGHGWSQEKNSPDRWQQRYDWTPHHSTSRLFVFSKRKTNARCHFTKKTTTKIMIAGWWVTVDFDSKYKIVCGETRARGDRWAKSNGRYK